MDNQPTGNDLSALAWVHGELRRSLETAHKALRRYLKEAEALGGSDVDAVDPAVLRTARVHLHQGVGALELVGLPAPAQVLRASEAAVLRMVSRPAMVDAAAIETVERTSFALLDFLGRTLAGKAVSTLALFPQYRAVQQLAGAERVHPADLWLQDWVWHMLPRDPAATPRAADDGAREAMESLVLALMRQPDPRLAARMSSLCADLGAGARGRLASLWQLAAAFFEAQAQGLLTSDVYSKRVASRLLAQLRSTVRGKDELSDRLAQDLLFFCAHARRPDEAAAAPRLAAVRTAWELDAADGAGHDGPANSPASSAGADYETRRLGRFDPSLISQARKRVAGANEAWSAVAGGEAHRLAGLAEQFALVGDSLQRLFPQGDVLAGALQTAVAQTVSAGVLPPPALAMEVATSMLYLDASLEDGELDDADLAGRVQRLARRIDDVRIGAEPQPLEAWMEELYRRVSDRQTMGSVVQELRATLSEVEKQIDQYFRDPSQRQVLIPVPNGLSAMRGVLSVLGMEQASQAVLHMRDDVDALAQTEVDPSQAIQAGTFDRLADNLGALSFLIDMLSVQPQLVKSLFRFDPDTGSLSAVMGQSERVSAFAAFDDEPGEPEPPAATTLNLPHIDLSPPPMPPAAASAQPADSGLEDDAEMREVFIEEAREVVQNARTSLERLSDQPEDQGEMTAVRRAFHTLKGSGRMVGLRDFGEAAWACEQLFNARLAQSARMDHPLRDFTTEALDYLSAWTEAIAAGRQEGHASPAVARAADALRLDGHRIAIDAPGTVRPAAVAATAGDAAVRAAVADAAVAGVALELPAAERPVEVAPEALAPALQDAPEAGPVPVAEAAAAAVDVPFVFDFEPAPETADADAEADGAWPGDGADGASADTLAARVPDLPTAADLELGTPLPETAEHVSFDFDLGNMAEDTVVIEALEPGAPPLAAEALPPDGWLEPAPGSSAASEALEALEGLDSGGAEAPEVPEAPPTGDAVEMDFADFDFGTPDAPQPSSPATTPALELDLDADPAAAEQPLPDAERLDGGGAATPARAASVDTALEAGLEPALWAEPEPAATSDAEPAPAAPAARPEPESPQRSATEPEPEPEPVSTAAVEPEAVPETDAGPAATALPQSEPGAAQEPEAEPAQTPWAPEPEPEPAPDATPSKAPTETPAVESEGGGEGEGDDEQVRQIGGLRISIPLFNIYLNEADELSRRLLTELAEWSLEYERQPVAEAAEALAHSLAGSSATVGYTELSALSRALEHALLRSHRFGRGRSGEPELFNDAAEEIRRLLHQFAAGFLRPVDAGLMQRLADHERWPAAEALPATAHLPLAAPDDGSDDDIDAVDALDDELFPIFEEEADELLPQLQNRLRDWAARPADGSAPAACMRTLHTFKGGARLAGAMRLGEMAHRLETVILQLEARGGVRDVDVEPLITRADAMSAAYELLRHRPAAASAVPAPVAAPAVHPPPAETAAAPPDGGVPAVSGAVAADAPASTQPQPAQQPDIDWTRFPPVAADPAAAAERAAPASTAVVRVRGTLLDRMVNQAGEVSIARARIDADVRQLQGSLNELTDSLDRLRRQLRDIELQAETQMSSRLEAAKSSAASFDPLEMDRFTRFQELTRFMAESVNDVATLQRSLQRTLQSTEDQLAAQARLTRELQDDLLRTRMVEFESMADRLYRTVRQAAKETAKAVRLDIVGGAIEMDRGVLERMAGPFEHLLRNCVAHGVEPPDARSAAGKDRSGSITVTVTQEGNEVGVEVRDDGAGLDLPRIRQRGVERGLMAADAAEAADDAAVAELIFQPGFSTAATVTELAGRGVGLDVVRAEVNAMGGRVQVDSQPGQGTAFKLLLPLTTAVTQVVMLRCGDLTVAVPSTLVENVRRMPSADMEQAYATGTAAVGDDTLPFYWLAALLQAGTRGPLSGKTQPLVVIRSAAQRVALHVDDVVGNQEVVVKNVGPQLARLPGLAGVTLLPSGTVALIYNPVALATLYGAAAHGRMHLAPLPAEPAAQPAAPQAPLVLVVDDSLTVRRVTQRLLLREGYRVTTAKDGLDALEKLAHERPAVMLSDIEMPRMDGFDLVRNVRAEAALAGLPVVMITSRIAQKHRDYAATLGVDHYLGKPYSEEELLSLVARYAGADILT